MGFTMLSILLGVIAASVYAFRRVDRLFEAKPELPPSPTNPGTADGP